MTDTWGLAGYTDPDTHLVDNGRTACHEVRNGKEVHRRIRYRVAGWKPEYPGTCPDCKRIYEKEQIVKKART